MAKKKNKKDTSEEAKKNTIITGAAIRDGFCVYGIDVKSGTGAGSHPSIKGVGIVDDDMKIAFAKMNAHLTSLDDAFKDSGIEDDINSLFNHELTHKYEVTAFQLKGTDEDRQVILSGTKFSDTASGHIDVKIPKQNLDRGNYKWYNELRECIEEAVREVEAYHGGKWTLPEKESEEAHDPKQLSIPEADFEESRVD